MKITKEFVEVLRNCSIINSSILFKPGYIISSCSKLNNIMSYIHVDEKIPVEFAIHDLNEFLNIVSILDDAVAEFAQNQIIIKSGRKSVKYAFSNPATIDAAPYREATFDDDDIAAQFKMNYSDFTNMLKACSVFRTSDVVISGDNDEVEICVGNIKNKTSNKFVTSYNTTKPCIKPFSKTFNIDNFKILNRDYIVSVHVENCLEFRTDDGRVSYWITPSVIA
jgi:hypothetical protein